MIVKALEIVLKTTNIEVNGPNPWDPQVKDDKVLQDIVRGGSLAAGETFMDERWDVAELDELVCRLQKHHLLLDNVLYGSKLLEKLGNQPHLVHVLG